MAWPRTKKPSTRHLLRAEHRPHVPRGYTWLAWAALLLIALLAGGYLLRAQDGEQMRARIAELEAANAQSTEKLAAALEEKRLKGEADQANSEQLMRRIDVMSAEIKKLKTELAFFRQQKPGK